MTKYLITKYHTSGILKGLTTKCTIDFYGGECGFKVGQVVKKAIGGGSYKIIAVEPVSA